MNFEPQPSVGNRVVDFLRRGGVWIIGDGRPKAREACTDFLMRVPDNVRQFIMEDHRIILFAPSADCPGMSIPFQAPQRPGEQTIRFACIYLAPALEKSHKATSLIVVAKCVANALKDRLDAEVLLNAWGFEVEMAKARGRWKRSVGGADVSEFVN
jgi:hypothetical protein